MGNLSGKESGTQGEKNKLLTLSNNLEALIGVKHTPVLTGKKAPIEDSQKGRDLEKAFRAFYFCVVVGVIVGIATLTPLITVYTDTRHRLYSALNAYSDTKVAELSCVLENSYEHCKRNNPSLLPSDPPLDSYLDELRLSNTHVTAIFAMEYKSHACHKPCGSLDIKASNVLFTLIVFFVFILAFMFIIILATNFGTWSWFETRIIRSKIAICSWVLLNAAMLAFIISTLITLLEVPERTQATFRSAIAVAVAGVTYIIIQGCLLYYMYNYKKELDLINPVTKK